MPSLANLPGRVAGQPMTKAIYDQLEATHDYLVVAGADLASATTIVPTNEFHKVTGAVTIRNIDHAAEVAGQQVRLWFTGAPTIEHNGGGVGNIRTQTGTNRVVRANQIVTFVYDGAVWREQDESADTISYVEFTAAVNLSTSYVQVVTTPAITYDGSPVWVEFFAPQFDTAGNDAAGDVAVFDGATDLGIVYRRAVVNTVGGTVGQDGAVLAKTLITPSAGSHTYNIRAKADGTFTTPVMRAGTGGVATLRPGWIRVSRFRD